MAEESASSSSREENVNKSSSFSSSPSNSPVLSNTVPSSGPSSIARGRARYSAGRGRAGRAINREGFGRLRLNEIKPGGLVDGMKSETTRESFGSVEHEPGLDAATSLFQDETQASFPQNSTHVSRRKSIPESGSHKSAENFSEKEKFESCPAVPLDESESASQGPMCLLFTSLPEQVTEKDLKAFCDFLGDCIELESIELFEDCKAKAVISGLTSEELSKAKGKKNHKIKKVPISLEIVSVQDDPVDSEEECTIEVRIQDFSSDNIDSGILEMYFESSKSGGSEDCVQNVEMLGDGIAHVTFNTHEDAERVIAKENHILLKKHSLKLQYAKKKHMPKTQKYDSTKLLIQNMPGNIEDEFVQLYLSSQMKMDSEEFSLERVGGIAVVHFSKDLSIAQLERIISYIQQKPLQNVSIEAKLYEVCTSIRVSNVSQIKCYNEEYLCLYFESKKSGGGVKVVQSCELFGNGEAVVSFADPKATQEVLKHPHAESFGDNGVLVELNDPLCIAKKKVKHTTSSLTTSPLVYELEPLLALSISKNIQELEEHLLNYLVELKIETKAGNIMVCCTKYTPANWKNDCTQQIGLYVQKALSIQVNIPIVKAAHVDLMKKLSNYQSESTSFVSNFEGDFLSIAGKKDVIDSAKKDIKTISDMYTETQVSISLNQKEVTYLNTLKLSKIRKDFPLVSISLDVEKISSESTHVLIAKGTVKETANFLQKINALKAFSEMALRLSSRKIAFLNSNQGRKKLLDFLSVNSFPLAVQFGNSSVTFLCDLKQNSVLQVAFDQLNQTLIVRENAIPKSYASLTSDEHTDFKDLCRKLTTQHFVEISTTLEKLIIVGFQENVKQCVHPLMECIKRICSTEESTIIEIGVWKLIKQHMHDKWQHIVSLCKELQVDCHESISDSGANSCTLSFKGDKLSVAQIIQEFSNLKLIVVKRSLEKSQPGSCKYFRSENARSRLDGYEARHKVIIEVTEADENNEATADIGGSASFDKVCSASIIRGGKKINILVGDITESKADVIVNAANEELKHIGGVALAIASKGGPIIQRDSDDYVRKQGKVDTGHAWLTENVGNLPCKALVHAVGPRWTNGRSREEPLLRKLCFQSLGSCDKKYCSISFPAISSGVYGFPLDKCAATMIEAFISYSEQHSVSTIQEINIVLFKKSDSAAFKLALQQRSDKIKISTNPLPQTPSYIPPFSGNQSTVKPKGRKKKASGAVPLSLGESPIKLHRGSLLDVPADVYVNTTNNDLNLSNGAVAQALLKAGGKSLQDACTAKAPINTGDVVETTPGNIPCQYILHTVVPNFDKRGGKSQKVLRRVVRSSLELCSKLGVQTVAFPSIGAGNLQFPDDIVAEVMVDEIKSFFALKKSSISTVHLVIFMKGTYQAFEMVLRNTSTTDALPVSHKGPIQNVPRRVKKKSQQPVDFANFCTTFGQVQVDVTQGDISDQDADTIVVPTNSTMKLEGSGVAGAILRKGGQELQNTCDTVLANFGTLPEGKVVVTPVQGTLIAKSLFHIVFESKDDKKFLKLITTCLHEADKLKYKSIAFPAIGTGIHGYPPKQAALGMYKAIEQASPNLKHVTQVRIVLYSHTDCSKFMEVFKNPMHYEKPGILSRALNYVFPPQVKASPIEAIGYEANQEIVIQIYGKSKASVSSAESDIENLIRATFITKEVPNKFINKLSQEEVQRLHRNANEHDVQIEIDPDPLNTIKIKGDESNVHKMHCFVFELLSDVEKTVKKTEESEKLHKTVIWYRIDSNNDEEEYSVSENYEIESAYRFRSGKGSYQHTSQSDKTNFTIDFDKNEETDHMNRDSKCTVKRVDLLKAAHDAPPKEWEKIPIDPATGKEKRVHIVDLQPTSQEYQDVQARFNSSMQSHGNQVQPASFQPLLGVNRSLYRTISKIQRIQNPTLHSQYIARKKEMDKQNPQGFQNERLLFHGTKPDTCPKINHGGFNRSYCGQNATMYGKGVYFARDAEYSARDTYSPADANGCKYIYLARVLTGEFTRGAGGMLVPPPKDPQNSHIPYDSVVDNVASPGIFVVFQDAQNYPDYLITFN